MNLFLVDQKRNTKIVMTAIESDEIYVPEADGMPLERWTAYMHCTAINSHLYPNYYLARNDGKSYIKRKQPDERETDN